MLSHLTDDCCCCFQKTKTVGRTMLTFLIVPPSRKSHRTSLTPKRSVVLQRKRRRQNKPNRMTVSTNTDCPRQQLWRTCYRDQNSHPWWKPNATMTTFNEKKTVERKTKKKDERLLFFRWKYCTMKLKLHWGNVAEVALLDCRYSVQECIGISLWKKGLLFYETVIVIMFR